MTKTLSLVVAAAALPLALAGCVVAPAPYAAQPYGGYGYTVVETAPPPLRTEVVGVAPAPGYFWISGFWTWFGGRYVWERGHWEAPRAGYRWVPHQWERHGPGWRANPGHWERH